MTTQTQPQIKDSKDLVQIINQSGLEKTKAQILLDNFSNYFEIAADWERKANALTVTDVSQVAEMKMAREGRLFLKTKRTDIEKTRKQLKESALREGQTIDAIAKILTNLIEPIETDLENKERFAIIQEEKRKAELKAKREIELEPYSEFVSFNFIDLGSMDEVNYQTLLSGAKTSLKNKIESEQKAEAERIAKKKAEEEERERIRIENEKLKADAEAREKQLELQRAKAEAERKALEAKAAKEKAAADEKLKREREAREKLEAELKAKADADAKAKKDTEIKLAAELKAKQDADKKAKAAPDKEKLITLAALINHIDLPDMKTEEGKTIIKNVNVLLGKVSTYILENTNKL